jgi:phosphoglucosamine mutase
LLLLDKHTTGDGIVSALQVLSALKRSGQTLTQATSALELFPQCLINVKVASASDWQTNSAVLAEKELVENELGKNGRVLIRASGTEPLVRVMVEAKSFDIAKKMAQRIADKLQT